MNAEQGLLGGLRIVEVSSFVAAPLCGLTLSQLGAEVIRVDPIGGGADYNRLPVTTSGESIYWTGLNRGKRSMAIDMRSSAGQQVIQQLITAEGDGGGIVVTNAGGRGWLAHDTLASIRPDVISLEILGRSDGSPAVDYTVNAAVGFPMITGPIDRDGAVNHVLPAWDVACGLYAATAVTAAVRHRERTGEGTRIRLPLLDVALAITSNLGYLTEVGINGTTREAVGNAVYGTYGTDLVTQDGARFMVVALTPRHFRDLVRITESEKAVAELEEALGVDFSDESCRFHHREVLTSLFSAWFARHTDAEVASALKESTVLHDRYRSFVELHDSHDVQANPLFAPLDQPRIGTYLAAGSPASFNGEHLRVGSASVVGSDTLHVLRDLLGVAPEEVAQLSRDGVV